MAKRLFVGGLPYSTTSDELRDLFSEAGTVQECTVVTDRYSGQSKGFAFVEMGSDEEADAVEKKFNGTQLGGRTLVVSEARPREERPREDRGGRGGYNDRGGDRRGGFGGDRGFSRGGGDRRGGGGGNRRGR